MQANKYSNIGWDCNDANSGLRKEIWVYHDRDNDGYGDKTEMQQFPICTNETVPSGYGTRWGDCDDNDALRNPGKEEICDNIDNDCDEVIDDLYGVAGGVC